MHSSRMRTSRSSGRPGGDIHQAPPRADPSWSRHPAREQMPPPGAATPLEQTPPGADTPMLTVLTE